MNKLISPKSQIEIPYRIPDSGALTINVVSTESVMVKCTDIVSNGHEHRLTLSGHPDDKLSLVIQKSTDCFALVAFDAWDESVRVIEIPLPIWWMVDGSWSNRTCNGLGFGYTWTRHRPHGRWCRLTIRFFLGK